MAKIDTEFTGMISVDYPIIGAPMFLISYEELAIAVDEGGEWVSVVRDITHRESHEERLQNSEQFFACGRTRLSLPF